MILPYKGINVFYSDSGAGGIVILLHGFLEDHTMWDDISTELVKTHRVITIDLLGHGKTGCLSDEHLMSDMADSLEAVLEHLDIEESTLIGHSMGGYAALAYAKKNTEKVKGLCLLNSTCKADDEELKALRSRANEMVKDNFESMVRVSFGNLFSEDSKMKFKPQFDAALKIALATSIQGYIAAQEGMKLRADLTSFYANVSFNKAIILGKKDAVLDAEAIAQFATDNNIACSVFSEGHMSHIENKTEYIDRIMHFIEKT